MRMFALGFATIDEAEDRDDPSNDDRSLEALASPRVAALAIDEDLEEKITQVKKSAEDEFRSLRSDLGGDFDGELLWWDGEWETQETGRPFRAFIMIAASQFDDPEAEHLARMEVQMVEGEFNKWRLLP